MSHHASAWPSIPPLPPGEVVVFAPDPAPWLGPVLRQLGAATTVWAPWARSKPPGDRWPRPLARPLTRRTVPGVRGIPGGVLVDAVVARLTADRPTLQYPIAHGRRRAMAAVAAWLLARRRPTAVIAPSLAGTPLFATARDLGARTVLVHDWPDLAALHGDLDRAAKRHPDDPWLRRFRPPADWIARQRSERHLADHILVRGGFLARRLTRDGIERERICTAPAPRVGARRASGGRVLLLAGRGAARAGAHEAVALLEAMPELRLTGALGSAAIPALREHPRFERNDSPPWPEVAAVVAPAWAEAYPAEVVGGAERGLPIIATAQAAGRLATSDWRPVEPGDVAAMGAALAELI